MTLSGVISFVLGSEFAQYGLAALAAMLAFAGVRLKFRRDGKRDANDKAASDDQAAANKVRRLSHQMAARNRRDDRSGSSRMRDDHPHNFIDE
jgi:hypothetical protein